MLARHQSSVTLRTHEGVGTHTYKYNPAHRCAPNANKQNKKNKAGVMIADATVHLHENMNIMEPSNKRTTRGHCVIVVILIKKMLGTHTAKREMRLHCCILE